MIYEISWYVTHHGRFNFYIRTASEPTCEQVQRGFEAWWLTFIAGAAEDRARRMREQFEKAFENPRVEKIEVIEL